MASTGSNVITLKLLIDSKGKRVLFAEAGKDFTDFLFSLLSMPVGTVTRLLSTKGMVGTLGKLYQSLENLSETYMQSNVNKGTLLKPQSSVQGGSATLFALTDNDTTSKKSLYFCNHCLDYGSDVPNATCPRCRRSIERVVTYVRPNAGTQVGSSSSSSSSVADQEGGFVKGVVTYMIMDDLEVKPMSTISSIAMLNTFNVKEVGALEEKTVSVGINEKMTTETNKNSRNNEMSAETPVQAIQAHIQTVPASVNTSHPLSFGERPDKFNGQNFKRWQQKMLFYLTTMNLARFVTDSEQKLKENEDDIQFINFVNDWIKSDFLCRNYVINGLENSLYEVYSTSHCVIIVVH